VAHERIGQDLVGGGDGAIAPDLVPPPVREAEHRCVIHAAHDSGDSRLARLGGGSIVNGSSTGGITKGAPGHGVYSASKTAVNHLAQTLALERAPRRIRVNAIAPGHTPMPHRG